MRKLLIFSVILIAGDMLMAQPNKPIKATLDKAIVYLQGAHLYYNETTMLKAGYNELLFENISPFINPVSLQANSKGGVVMDVKHQLKYKEQPVFTGKYDKAIERVLDSLNDMSFDIKDINNKLKVLASEKQLLLNNNMMKGVFSKDSLPLLKDGMQFLRDKLNNIYDLELKQERLLNAAEALKIKLTTRYNELLQLKGNEGALQDEYAQPIHQILVTIYSENAGSAAVGFNYFMQEASWVPLYDLQASSTTNTLQLKYMANVTQNSGINWKGVSLTLSTSNPAESNVKPELTPWFVTFIEYARKPQPVSYRLKTNQVTVAAKSEQEDLVRTNSDGGGTTTSNANELKIQDFVTVSENLIRTEYDIKLKYQIESDNQPHKVIINQRDVPVHLKFAAVPKLCTEAFLMADITGWEEMNIIPGNARLFFDGAYVGETLLDAQSTSDTLNVNLGRDKNIVLMRKKVKEKTKVRFLDDDKVETHTVEITVRNTKNIPIELLLEDQIPVARNTNDIKITLAEGSRAELDETTGKLKWLLKLNSKDTKKVVFTYEIRYPKNKVLAGL
ncbi:MAG: mucoidy inhibitor MuiA family protein [Bacteroidetes bacterium]|nr:MAG: mucoidy inhibitor MuiA family protein [Bacteroidota bacterium]